MRNRKTRIYRLAAVCLAVLMMATAGLGMAADLATGYVISETGKSANFNFDGNKTYDSPIVIRKTVSELEGERDFQLSLTATGYDWTNIEKQDIYAIFVIDTTSSMNISDVPTSETDKTLSTRNKAVKEAAKAYVDAFFAETPDSVTKHIAIVSYGAGARLHVWEGYNGAGSDLVKAGVVERTQDTGLKDNFFAQSGSEKANRLSSQGSYSAYNALIASTNDYYAKFTAAMAGNAADVFTSDADTAKTVIDNMITFSDTNIESGLLMANFLLDNLMNASGSKSTDPAHIFLLTDGEANSTSSIINYETSKALTNWVGRLDKEDNGAISFAGIMADIVDDASDANFIKELTEVKTEDINFFLGNYNNLDRKCYVELDGGTSSSITPNLNNVLSAILGSTAAKPLQSQGDRTDEEYYAAVDAAIAAALEAKKTTVTNVNARLEAFAKYMLLIAETRTDYYTDKAYTADFLVKNEAVFGEYMSSGVALFGINSPFGGTKTDALSLYDYGEHSGEPKNASGSDSAKRFMQEAADLVKANSNVTLYSTGIGSLVLMPDKLKATASERAFDTFFLCANTSTAPIKNAEALKSVFATLGYETSLSSVSELTITDFIKRRETTTGDDDTFTVNGAIAQIYYIDESGEVALLVLDATPTIDGATSYNGTPATSVTFNFGKVYSGEVAAEKKSAEFPFKVEILIDITANEGVVATEKNVPDIETNLFADVTWVDGTGDNDMEYPYPKVYFDPPQTSETSSQESSEISSTVSSEISEQTRSETSSVTTIVSNPSTPLTTTSSTPSTPNTTISDPGTPLTSIPNTGSMGSVNSFAQILFLAGVLMLLAACLMPAAKGRKSAR